MQHGAWLITSVAHSKLGRVDCKDSPTHPHTQTVECWLCEVATVLVILILVIILQCAHIPVIMLNTLNVHNYICQLLLNKVFF